MNVLRILPLLSCLLFATFSAQAGSVSFDELKAVIQSNPDFDGQFEAMKIDENGEGQRLGRHYGTVAGARVGPYKFRAAFKGGMNEGQAVDLVLHTRWHLQDASGKRYEGDPPEPPPASAGEVQIVEFLQRVEVISLRQSGSGASARPTMPSEETTSANSAGLPNGTPTLSRSLKEGDVKFAGEYFTQAFAVPMSSGQILEVIMHSTQFRPTILSNFQHWRGSAGARHTPVKGESIARIQQQAKGDDPLIVMLMSEDKHQGGEFRAWFFLDGKLIAPITDFTPDLSFDRISKNKPTVKVPLLFGSGSTGASETSNPPTPAPSPMPEPAPSSPPTNSESNPPTSPAIAMASIWNGTWDSDFGQLRLVQDGRRVYGDYANEGYFEARTDRDRPFILRGTFQKENGDWGLFEFTMEQDHRRFGGPWEWTQKFPTANSARWTGRKTADITGPLVNAVGKPAYWAKPYEKRFPIEITEWMDTGKLPVSKKEPALTPNSMPAIPMVDDRFPLHPTTAFDQKKVETIRTMQEHVFWISQASETQVVELLKAAGYEVVGGKLITSEVDLPVLKQLTTERLRCYVAAKGEDVVICFRGSLVVGEIRLGGVIPSALNGLTDANIRTTTPSFFTSASSISAAEQSVLVHQGFDTAYQRLRPQILAALLQHPGKKVYVFGHSLGAAQATLCALDLAVNAASSIQTLTHVVSGSPRVGDSAFRSLFEKKVSNHFRIVVQGDPVAMIPQRGLNGRSIIPFVHAGRLLQIGPDGVTIKPQDITTKLSERNTKNHGNALYRQAVGALYQRASRADYFKDKASLPQQMADAERAK